MKSTLTIKKIKSLAAELNFRPDDKFVKLIYDDFDKDYFISKAYEQLKIKKLQVTRDELKDIVKILMLAILKGDDYGSKAKI